MITFVDHDLQLVHCDSSLLNQGSTDQNVGSLWIPVLDPTNPNFTHNRPFQVMAVRLTHIAKSWKIFPKIGWSLRGFLGKFFQTFFKISDFGSWVRSISGKFFQPNFLSTYSGKMFVFWFRVMSEELFWKIFPASFHECLLRKKVCSHYLGMTRKSFWSFLSHINNTGIEKCMKTLHAIENIYFV